MEGGREEGKREREGGQRQLNCDSYKLAVFLLHATMRTIHLQGYSPTMPVTNTCPSL
jgi:hypothetical protein